MIESNKRDLTHDLFLPTLLFAALGGMGWAVRGCSGFGAVAGCIFAGVMWGAAWWFIAHDPTREQSRRYSSGWIVLAVTIGIGISGARGWMQWPSFFEEKLVTNYAKNEYVPISRFYGFLWWFIAGVPWAGIGACMLAWCGSLKETRVWHWVIRIAMGLGGGALAMYLFRTYPQYFLPLYDSLEQQYHDFDTNPSLRRLTNDCRSAVHHMGYFLGFLLYEIVRRDWKNVLLIASVGGLNGIGWAACQNWKWAPGIWPEGRFNWWRCWESSGGISIGIALGIGYFLVNRPMREQQRTAFLSRRAIAGPNFEWLLVYLGLTFLAGLYLRGQMDGWGTSYFALALLFGPAYYLLNRNTAIDGAPRQAGTGGMLANVEWSAVLLSAAFVFALYYLRPDPKEEDPIGQFFRNNTRFLGIAMLVGIVLYLVRHTTYETEKVNNTPTDGDPNLQRLGVYLGLLMGLGLSLRNGLKGWFNIYKGDEEYWSGQLWQYLGPTYLAILIVILVWILLAPLPRDFRGRLFPYAYALMWLVLIVQNIIAQLITGPLTNWNEMVFSFYYVLLFFSTAAIVAHYHYRRPFLALRGQPI